MDLNNLHQDCLCAQNKKQCPVFSVPRCSAFMESGFRDTGHFVRHRAKDELNFIVSVTNANTPIMCSQSVGSRFSERTCLKRKNKIRQDTVEKPLWYLHRQIHTHMPSHAYMHTPKYIHHTEIIIKAWSYKSSSISWSFEVPSSDKE